MFASSFLGSMVALALLYFAKIWGLDVRRSVDMDISMDIHGKAADMDIWEILYSRQT